MATPPPLTPSSPEFFTAQTLLSLASTVAILATAYLASQRLLPTSTSTKLRALYIWHTADGLTHLTLEASYLYNCFFTSAPLSPLAAAAAAPAGQSSSWWARLTEVDTKAAVAAAGGIMPAGALNVGTTAFLYGDRTRGYGPAYGSNPTALLWQEYAKADRRWGGADLTVISLELLTVLIAGPLALYVGELIRRGAASGMAGKGRETAKMWFWASALATGELYGGFMTFAPEWLSGNENLDGSNAVYLWLYLVFFNMLWVFIPFWVLYEAYQQITGVFVAADVGAKGKKKN